MEVKSDRADDEGGDPRLRRRRANSLKESMRVLSNQLSLLNHHVCGRLAMRDVDLDCLDLISRQGPLAPSAVARLAGLHPATVTGVLDRLQKAGWISRERDPSGADRRAVSVRALPDRGAEVFALYAGMNSRLDDLCAGYTLTELEVIDDFLRRASVAGRDATESLADDGP